MIGLTPVDPAEVLLLRDLRRVEAGCQIRHESSLTRGFLNVWKFLLEGEMVGYGGCFHVHYPHRIADFYLLPEARLHARDAFRLLAEASGAQEFEAQTNMPLDIGVLLDCCHTPTVEFILFQDGPDPGLEAKATLRRGPDAWLLEVDGQVAGRGDFLTHYNPPYADIYFEIEPGFRGQGLGTFLVQELKRNCRAAGLIPAARCAPENEASRRTMEHAGLVPCARLVVGKI